ncbi:MAG: DUF3540 domain-containing protein [Byssovorax sp.]
MDNLARTIEQTGIFQATGEVIRVEGPVFTVRNDDGDYRARRAVSCLVEPERGDEVLLVVREGACFVLAVLTREEPGKTRLSAEGDLEVSLKKGRFVVASQEGIDLVAAKDVSITSGRVNLRAAEGNMIIDRLSMLGTIARAEIEKVKLLAGSLDSVLDRLHQKVKRSYKRVEEVDQVKAGQIDYVADKTMCLRSENTVMTAEELVKVDADQVHLG